MVSGSVIDKNEVYAQGGDRKVVVGIRPESFTYSEEGGKIPVDITSIVRIGRDVSVLGKVKDEPESSLKIIIPSENYDKLASKEHALFSAKRIYVFEKTGERII